MTNVLLSETPDWSGVIASISKRLSSNLSKKKSKKKSEKLISSQKNDDETNLNMVTACIDVIIDVMRIYGLARPVGKKRWSVEKRKSFHSRYTDSYSKSINLWMDYVGIGNSTKWKDLMKYKICAFFACVFSQDCPPVPKGLTGKLACPGFLLCGVFKHWMQRILSSNRDNLESFAVSILQSKKGAPPLSENAVLKSRFDTFVQLTSEPKQMGAFTLERTCRSELEWDMGKDLDWILQQEPLALKFNDIPVLGWEDETGFATSEGLRGHTINRKTVEEQLRRTAREIFKNKKMTPEDIYSAFVPSTSANYNYSRNGMGALGSFYDNIPEAGKCQSLLKTDIGFTTLHEELPTMYGKQLVEQVQRLEESLNSDDPLLKQKDKETVGLLFDATEVEEKWKGAYDHLWFKSFNEPPVTKTVGLTEPLKVRVITCGPPILYTVMKPFQKYLWKTLKSMKVFKLIGETITAENIFESLGFLPEGFEFISGDYKASTDNLHSWVSEILSEEIMGCLSTNSTDINPEFMSQASILMKRSLTQHILENPIFGLEYDDSYGIDRDTFDKYKVIAALLQKEGQLMGSITSFPFLCIANAALCRYAMEISENRRWSLRDVPLLCNGDDCILKVRKCIGRLAWEMVTKFGGLESSVGKTYFSDKFAVMNSVHFNYKPASWTEEATNPFHEVAYVNLGLVYGQKKSGVRGKPVEALGALHHKLFETCPSRCWKRANRRFLKVNRSILEEYEQPWYLPKWCGGIGLRRPDDYAGTFDRVVVFSIMKTLKEKGTFSLDHDVPRLVKDEPEWKMFALAQRDLRKSYGWMDKQAYKTIIYDDTERDLESEALKLRNWMIVEQLFTKPLGLAMGHDYGDTEMDANRLYVGAPDPGFAERKSKTRHHNVNMWKFHILKIISDSGLYQECCRNLPTWGEIETLRYDYSIPVFDVRV